MPANVVPAAEVGLTWDELGETAYLAFLRACEGVEFPPLAGGGDWQALADREQAAWAEAGRLAWSWAQAEVEGAAAVLAGNLYRHWAGHAGGYARVGWEELALPHRVAWEAALRHLQYVVSDMGPGENLARLQDKWAPWAAERLRRAAGNGASDA